MATVLTTSDLRSFKRCRRAWDFGSPSRRNLAPKGPLRPFELDSALRAALAVYYYPGMWTWPRAVVEPLALNKYTESMTLQFERHKERFGATEEDRQLFDGMHPVGEAMLRRYLAWAPSVDWVDAVRVDTDFRVNPPHPDRPEDGLVHRGHAVQYAGRIDLLAVEQAEWRREGPDDDTVYWIVHHRVAGESWAELADLAIDDRACSSLWAGQDAARVRVAGVVVNELRAGTDLPERVLSDPSALSRGNPPDPLVEAELAARLADERIRRQTSQWCRRTWIAAEPWQVLAHQQRDSEVIAEMLTDGLPVYPSPSVENCTQCVFRAPCIAMNRGDDPGPVLEAGYRERVDDLADVKGWPNQERRHSESHLGRWSAW